MKRREPGIIKLAKTFNDLCKELEQLKRQGKAPRNSTVPRSIDTRGLFNLDVDDDIWQDVGMDDGTEGLIPQWMGDEAVREGIKAFLQLDRCLEERARLQHERSAMQDWMKEEWDTIQVARTLEGM
jgi:hypothetical protein